jgi:hypothetical protein
MAAITDAHVKRDALVERLIQPAAGVFGTCMTDNDDRLGLCEAMSRRGACISAELARRTGTQARYVRGWRTQQTVIGRVVERFNLTYPAPLAQLIFGRLRPRTSVLEAFRSGGGVPFSDDGAGMRSEQGGLNRAMPSCSYLDKSGSTPPTDGTSASKRTEAMSHHRSQLVAAYVALALVALIDGRRSLAAAAPQPASVEPNAGTWPTWLLSSGSELRPSAAPDETVTMAELVAVQALAAARDQASLDRIRYWDAGAPPYRWIQRSVKYMQDHGVAGNRAARLLALLTTAMYDATIAAWDAKYAFNRRRPSDLGPHRSRLSPRLPVRHIPRSGHSPPEQQRRCSNTFPNDADLFNAWASEAAQSRVEAGVAFSSDSADGLTLGSRVGQKAVEWGRTNGSDAVWSGSVPNASGKWTGTNPIEPLAGTWKAWALTSGSQFRPAPRAAPDSDQLKSELAEVGDYPRTNLSNLIASFWE